MARYWMYLEGKVEGPYGVEQLIRKKGFSRQTLVCVEDSSGKPQNWISPADIPELAHIFKAIDEKDAEPQLPPRPVVKRSPQPPRTYSPAVTLKPSSSMSAATWGWILLVVLLVAGGSVIATMQIRSAAEKTARQEVRRLIENMHFSSGAYGTLGEYLQEKAITPRWEFEKKIKGLYTASVSWYAPGSQVKTQTVYAFEVNTQAQTVRALNSAAAKLLSGAFASALPAKSTTPPSESKKAKSTPSFDSTIESHVESLSSGDFQAVWSRFSKRKKAEMASGGISRDGFIRLQSLTHKLESGAKTSLVKSKEEGRDERLVLLKQTQPGKPDIFIKQLWVKEDSEWKLDDEQKRSPDTPETAETPVLTPPAAASPTKTPPPATLPGMSN